MSAKSSCNSANSHLKDAQRGEIVLRRLPPRVIEHIDGGNDDGEITANFSSEVNDRLRELNHILSVALE